MSDEPAAAMRSGGGRWSRAAVTRQGATPMTIPARLWRLVSSSLLASDAQWQSLVRRVLADNRGHWKSYASASAFMAVVSAMTVVSAWLMKDVVNEVFIERKADLILPLVLAIFAIFAVKGAAGYAQEVTISRVGNRVVADNQRRAFDHVLELGVDHFAAHSSSDMIAQVSGGVAAIRNVLMMIVMSLARDLLTLAGLVGVMVLQAPLLSAVAFVAGPFAILGITRLVHRIRALATSEFMLTARTMRILQEAVHGVRVVKVFHLADHMRDQMRDAVEAVETQANRMAELQARTSPVMDAFGGMSVGLVMAYAGWSVINGVQTPGEFMAFATALLLSYGPAKRLARLNVSLGAELVGVQIFYRLLDTPAGASEMPTGRELDFAEGRIEFRDVSFAYRPGAPVLKGISLEVPANARIALVGPSGGGKTTIFSLIARFHDAMSGCILIDGQDLREISADSIRRRISFVGQETFLFGGTIRDNIRIGRLAASDEEIERAAREAHAHDFIEELPHGYDSHVGENGVQLSGGQRQRIAIARALLKDAPIVLLDEATSALDSESEWHVQQALDRLGHGRTMMIIAHRLSTVLGCDRIVVIDQGHIVAEGTHRELQEAGGLYARLCRRQFMDRHEAAETPA